MRNCIFIEYLFNFQQHIDAIKYDVVIWKFNLKNELFSELKALLIQMNVSSLNYEQLIIKCQQLNSRYCVTVSLYAKVWFSFQVLANLTRKTHKSVLNLIANKANIWISFSYFQNTSWLHFWSYTNLSLTRAQFCST